MNVNEYTLKNSHNVYNHFTVIIFGTEKMAKRKKNMQMNMLSFFVSFQRFCLIEISILNVYYVVYFLNSLQLCVYIYILLNCSPHVIIVLTKVSTILIN